MGTVRFLTKRDIAVRLRCHPNSIPRMVQQGRFPPPVRLSRTSALWPESEFEAWAKAQIQLRDQAAGLHGVEREQGIGPPLLGRQGEEEPV
jgi:predicted DNA-binding transcriptional regulator AlpA